MPLCPVKKDDCMYANGKLTLSAVGTADIKITGNMQIIGAGAVCLNSYARQSWVHGV
jgi:hypothetical protein